MLERHSTPATPEINEHPRLLLEVGTINFDGIAAPGFVVSKLRQGDRVVTVDLPIKYGHQVSGSYLPTNPDEIRSSYVREKGRHCADKGSAPDFEHGAVIADGRQLPFGDDTFDTVLLNDVIGDPAVNEYDIRGLIDEALRVLKVGGEIWVVDDRALGSNLTSLGRQFPATSPDEMAGYTREDLVFPQDLEDLARSRTRYEQLCRKVHGSDPNFTVIRKAVQWQPTRSTEINPPAIEPPPVRRRSNPFVRWFGRP